jgi:Flp pilus assembly protein CpaB
VLAILAVSVAVRLIVPGVVGALQHTAPVVVTAREVQAGETFDSQALVVAELDRGAIPDGALTDVDQVVGSRATADLPAGYPLAPSLVHSAGALANAPAGTVAAPVRLSDAAAAGVLTAGDRIDVLAAGGTKADGSLAPAQRIAAGALVLAVPPAESMPTGLVVLALTPEEARLVGGASAWSVLSAVLVG